MDDIFLSDLGLARKERNEAIARAEAAEGEVARLREVLNALVGEEPPMDSAEALRTR